MTHRPQSFRAANPLGKPPPRRQNTEQSPPPATRNQPRKPMAHHIADHADPERADRAATSPSPSAPPAAGPARLTALAPRAQHRTSAAVECAQRAIDAAALVSNIHDREN